MGNPNVDLCKYLYHNQVKDNYSFSDYNGTVWRCEAVSKGRPYACIVATGKNKVGWALVNKTDFYNSKKRITKKSLREIALARINTSKKPPLSLAKEIEHMRARSERYFK